MYDITNKIEARIAAMFMDQVSLKFQGKELKAIDLLGVTLQPRLNNEEVEEFVIRVKGQITDENGEIQENCYTCTASAKVKVCVNIEPINVISVTKN